MLFPHHSIPSACTELSEYFVEHVVAFLSLPECQYVQIIEFHGIKKNTSFKNISSS